MGKRAEEREPIIHEGGAGSDWDETQPGKSEGKDRNQKTEPGWESEIEERERYHRSLPLPHPHTLSLFPRKNGVKLFSNSCWRAGRGKGRSEKPDLRLRRPHHAQAPRGLVRRTGKIQSAILGTWKSRTRISQGRGRTTPRRDNVDRRSGGGKAAEGQGGIWYWTIWFIST